MHHDNSLIATIAVGLTFAFLGGLLAVRLRLPPLVGYLLAGIAVGPFTPGFVADARLAPQLAEVGVILLMFGVGMHFSIRDLWSVRAVAVPGAIGQIAVATALGAGVASLWGWTLGAGIVLGLALSVASTVVLLRALEDRGLLDTGDGRIAVGWLIVEDLAMVLALIVLPALAGAPAAHAAGGAAVSGATAADLGAAAGAAAAGATAAGVGKALALALGKVLAFVAAALLVGARLFPWLLRRVEGTGSGELFTLAVIALSLGVAFGSALVFGVSFALGAFFAGVMVHASDLSQRAAREMQPLQSVFAALFFVAMGMLFDPSILTREPLRVLVVVGIVVVGKSLAGLGIVLLLRHPLQTGLTVSAALAQIGEFSFILSGLGVALGLVSAESHSLVVAAALLSITLNPLVFSLLGVGREPRAAQAPGIGRSAGVPREARR